MLIQPGGLLALRELGALDAFAQASVPIHRLEAAATVPGCWSTSPMRKTCRRAP